MQVPYEASLHYSRPTHSSKPFERFRVACDHALSLYLCKLKKKITPDLRLGLERLRRRQYEVR